MRVTFITQDDPLYILPFFEEFLGEGVGDIQVCAIFACRSMGSRSRSTLLMELIRLYGPLGFARLSAIQARERTASALRISKVTGKAHSIADLAHSHGIPYSRIGNPNWAENLGAIGSTQPDLLVSVACPFLLKRNLLELPSMAALNIHHAPLPRYKGMMPTFWQMYHGEKEAGITIHTMAERLDSGMVIHQESVPVIPGESMHNLIRRSKRAGGRAMAHVLQRFARSDQPQPTKPRGESTYFSFPSAGEMRIFRQRGLRAI